MIELLLGDRGQKIDQFSTQAILLISLLGMSFWWDWRGALPWVRESLVVFLAVWIGCRAILVKYRRRKSRRYALTFGGKMVSIANILQLFALVLWACVNVGVAINIVVCLRWIVLPLFSWLLLRISGYSAGSYLLRFDFVFRFYIGIRRQLRRSGIQQGWTLIKSALRWIFFYLLDLAFALVYELLESPTAREQMEQVIKMVSGYIMRFVTGSVVSASQPSTKIPPEDIAMDLSDIPDSGEIDDFEDDIPVKTAPKSVVKTPTREDNRRALREKRRLLRENRQGRGVPSGIQNNSQFQSMIRSIAPEVSMDEINAALNNPEARSTINSLTKKTGRGK